MAKRVKAAGRQQFNARYDVTCGMDTDKMFVVVGVFDATTGGAQTREFEQTRRGAEAAAAWVSEFGVEIAIIESTANYHLLFYDIFRLQKIPIYVINPIVVKSLLRVEGKSDKADALTLARLAASFDLRVSNMPDAQMREIRNVMRWRDKELRLRTQVTNMIASMLTAAHCTLYRMCKINSVSGRNMLDAILRGDTPTEVAAFYKGRKYTKEDIKASVQAIPPYLFERLTFYRADLLRTNERLDYLDQQILGFIEQFDLTEQIEMMKTCPPVTDMLALRLIGEMGADYWHRYRDHRAFAKALGLAPNNEVSGGKLLKRKSSHGNSTAKRHFRDSVKAWLLYSPANDPHKEWFVNYRSRANYPKAVNALARKWAEALFHMGLKGEPYRPAWLVRRNQENLPGAQEKDFEVEDLATIEDDVELNV